MMMMMMMLLLLMMMMMLMMMILMMMMMPGCPGVPRVSRQQSEAGVYSCDLAWALQSSYPLLQVMIMMMIMMMIIMMIMTLLQHELTYWQGTLSSPPATATTRRVPAALATRCIPSLFATIQPIFANFCNNHRAIFFATILTIFVLVLGLVSSRGTR